MASATVATVSVAAPVSAQLGGSRVLSRRSTVLNAPRTRLSSKLVCNNRRSRVVMMGAAQQKDIDLAGLTTAALIAAAVIPEIAEAAAPGVSPSLKNLLLSVLAGGVIFAGIAIVVAGVSTFDPVKRR